MNGIHLQQKTSLDISCESSTKQMIHMKCQDLFSMKNDKKCIKVSSTAAAIVPLRVKLFFHVFCEY